MIVLDDLNVAPLRTKVVINAARELIEQHFAPNDIAAITYTSGRTDGAQEFTSDRAALLAAIDKFQGRKLRSTVIEKADQYFQQTSQGAGSQLQADDPDSPAQPQSGTIRGPNGYSDITTDPDDFERGHRAQQVLSALGTARRSHGRHPRTPQGDRDVQRRHRLSDLRHLRIAGGDAVILTATRDAIAAAARANVSFFAVDPRGLVGMTSEAIELNAPTDPSLGFDAKGLLADMYLSQDSLRTLADETGGYAAVNSNNLSNSLDRIVKLNSTYYVLGLLPEGRPARRPFSQDRSSHQATGASRLGAKGIRVGARVVSAEDRARAGARARARPRARRLRADVE